MDEGVQHSWDEEGWWAKIGWEVSESSKGAACFVVGRGYHEATQ